jgi:hypothetical protein
VRLALGVLVGAVVAALGAAILGEYQFNGVTGVAAGLILGLFVAEAALAAAGHGSPILAAACAALTVAALVWAVHASIGARAKLPGDVPTLAWVAMVAGAAAAGFRARSSGRQVAGTPERP